MADRWLKGCGVPLRTRVTIGGICEQDLDLFLLEECVSNDRFLSWLLEQVPGWPPDSRELLAAARSVDQGNGESDLELTVSDGAGRVGRLLIENKLGAGFQPQQLARYRERAAMYLHRDECAHSAVVLFAPSAYARRSAGEVDAVVSYEAVEAWLAATNSDQRIGYKRQLIRSALEKHHLGYNPETDEPVTTFWHLYWREAAARAPELQLNQTGPKPAGAGFVWFRPVDLPASLNICHKLPKGFVDLQFPKCGHRIPMLMNEVGPLLESEMEIVRASKSAAIRIRVPTLNTGRPFEEQTDAVRDGLSAARRLHTWAARNSSRIQEILAAHGVDAGQPKK
jgi:hypothetical protein